MADSKRCLWPTGTVYSGPRDCGKPAKAVALHVPFAESDRLPVCGIHRNAAVRARYAVEEPQGAES